MSKRRASTNRRRPAVRAPAPASPGISPLAILPLRLFLGITFVYAGLQKVTDPRFLHAAGPASIGEQMAGYVRSGSPLSPLISHLGLPHPVLIGTLIALAELWVGLATLLGILARPAAAVGLLTSLVFFLTATWNVHPYFLGSDLPYAAGWLTLLLTVPGPYTFGNLIARVWQSGGLADQQAAVREPARRLSRASFLRSLAGGAALAAASAGLAAALGRRGSPRSASASEPGAAAGNAALLPSEAAVSSATRPGTTATRAAGAAAPPGMALLGNTRMVPPNSAGGYTDPISGDPAVFVHLQNGRFVAFDAVCTHAGCSVQYDPTQQMLVCPCHGAVFDPAKGAQVVSGPTDQPLAPLNFQIATNGDIYVKTSR